jgi:hypothetical protein
MNEDLARAKGRTIPRIGLEHPFYDEELSFPSRPSPCLSIRRIGLLWDVLETPSPMIPDPVDFRVNFERHCCHGQVLIE